MPIRKPDIENVQELYAECQELMKNVSNLWGLAHHTTTTYKMRLPGVTTIHVSDDRFQVQTFLLDGIPELAEHLKRNDPCQPLVLPELNHNFRHVVVWLKLRWLIKLFCACCELDYKLCGVTRLASGLLRIITSQYLITPGDSIFTDHCKAGGVFLNLESFLDDMMDGFARLMGVGWRDFTSFVSTCGPYRICNSPVDIDPPKLRDCKYFTNLIHDIFCAYLLRRGSDTRFMDIIEDIDKFGLPQPEIPQLDWSLIEDWDNAKSRADMKAKLRKCQRQTIHVLANVELRNAKCFLNGEAVAWEEVEKIDPALFKILLIITSHHNTFPNELRQRIYDNLPQLYNLTTEQHRQLDLTAHVNRDLKLLSADQLGKLRQKCLDHLCYLDEHVLDKPRCMHLRQPALVCRLKEAPYIKAEKLASNVFAETAPHFQKHPYTRQLEGGGDSRPAFKVLKGKGAFVFNRRIGRFQLSRVFSEAPVLGNE